MPIIYNKAVEYFVDESIPKSLNHKINYTEVLSCTVQTDWPINSTLVGKSAVDSVRK